MQRLAFICRVAERVGRIALFLAALKSAASGSASLVDAYTLTLAYAVLSSFSSSPISLSALSSLTSKLRAIEKEPPNTT